MENLRVQVCVCTECVMKGAMDIIESIESLNDVKDTLGMERGIVIEHVSKLPKVPHACPAVMVGEVLIENATTQTVMAEILNATGSNLY